MHSMECPASSCCCCYVQHAFRKIWIKIAVPKGRLTIFQLTVNLYPTTANLPCSMSVPREMCNWKLFLINKQQIDSNMIVNYLSDSVRWTVRTADQQLLPDFQPCSTVIIINWFIVQIESSQRVQTSTKTAWPMAIHCTYWLIVGITL